jgi:hypothetical protein
MVSRVSALFMGHPWQSGDAGGSPASVCRFCQIGIRIAQRRVLAHALPTSVKSACIWREV